MANIALATFSHRAWSDNIELINDYKLTGIVTEQASGKVNIDTSCAGSIEVRLEEIQSRCTFSNGDEPERFR